MASTVVGTLGLLAKARKELEEWDCGRIDMLVATSITDNTLVAARISDTIGHGKQVPKPRSVTTAIVFGYARNGRKIQRTSV